MKSMSLIRYLPVLVCLCVFTMVSVPCLGDAIIVNRSMKASTIAEIHVDRGTIRTDIEVGLRDLKAFRNLLPDALYEKLGYKPNPLTQRLAEFLAKDWSQPKAWSISIITSAFISCRSGSQSLSPFSCAAQFSGLTRS